MQNKQLQPLSIDFAKEHEEGYKRFLSDRLLSLVHLLAGMIWV